MRRTSGDMIQAYKAFNMHEEIDWFTGSVNASLELAGVMEHAYKKRTQSSKSQNDYCQFVNV